MGCIQYQENFSEFSRQQRFGGSTGNRHKEIPFIDKHFIR